MTFVSLLAALLLGTGPRSFGEPAWSPDGTKVAWANLPFTGGGESEAEIWTANADGTGAAPLLKGFRNGLFQVVWTQSNTLLFDANFQVFRATPNGRYHFVLPSTGSTFTTAARGDRVASVCDRCNGPIMLATVATGKRVELVAGADPTLSPDGARIAFSRNGLWVERTNGTSLRRIDRSGSCPTWSPAGNLIAYTAPEKSGLVLRVIAPDGSRRRVLLTAGALVCSVPLSLAWSPDGTRIAYATPGWGPLVVLDVASRRTTTVTAFASVTGVAWSPDGTRLLVTARPRDTACSSLWLVGADGTGAALVRHC